MTLIRSLSRVQVQNGLMRLSDREIALAMRRMDPEDRTFALSYLPEAKASRVKDELRYQTRLKVTDEQYRKVIGIVIEALSGGRRAEPSKSFIRPRRGR